MENFSDFPVRLRTVLQELKLTQVDAAQRLGISKYTLTKYLTGRIPETGILFRIAKLSGKSMEWLLTGKSTLSIVADSSSVLYCAETPASPTNRQSDNNPRETELIHIFQQLSPDTQSIILGIIRTVLQNSRVNAPK